MNARPRAIIRMSIVPVVVLVGVLVAWKLGYFELDRRQELYDRVQRFRMMPAVEVGFVATYVLVVALCLPVTVMNVLAGAVFGFAYGAAFAFAGSQLGTVLTYLVAKTIARRPLTRVFGEHRLLRMLRDHDGVTALFRLRVLPVAPFGVLPYVSGIADVSLRRLLIASVFGALPQILAYAWLGNALLSAAISQGEAAKRALWIAGAVTVVMLAASLIPSLRGRGDR